MAGPMTRILVLQLCRLGDIIQTTPMLRGLRRQHPDADITLVLHDMMARAPVPNALYDRLIPFPYSRIGAGVSDHPDEWAAHARLVTGFVDSVCQTAHGVREPFDVILNLTHSDLSGFLTALIPSRAVQGALIGRDRRRMVVGPWMTYFWSSQLERVQGCFNLVDLHNWMAGVPCDGLGLEVDVPDTARASIAAWLDARGLADEQLIAVQMGASDERKRWKPEQFADAINRLPPDLGEIVFVGSDTERHLVEQARAHLTRPTHDATGSTTLLELAALLARSRLLLTNDTGTMHVAAAVGTRIVDISTGPVFVHETGPYGLGHFVIEPSIDCYPCVLGSDCRHIACREDIEPRDVAALAAHALGAGPMPTPARARIMTAEFTPSGRIDYRTVWPQAQNRAEIMRQASAQAWEATLGAPGASVPARAGERAKVRRLPLASREASDVTALRGLADVARTAASLAAQIAWSTDAERAHVSEEVSRCLRLLQRASQMETVCQPIVAYLTVRLDSVIEADLAGVSRVYAEECGAAADRADLLADLLTSRYRAGDWRLEQAAS